MTVSARLPFDFDASDGGRLFTDPDGDALTYHIGFRGATSAGPWFFRPPVDPANPQDPDNPVDVAFGITIVAHDGRGGESVQTFVITRRWNLAPTVVKPNSALFPAPNEQVNHDLSQGGTTFADPDRDPLTYTVEMVTPAGRGFAVQGLNAVGALTGTNVATFKITASDGSGETATDTFVVARAAPLSETPTLPATSFVYADASLPLPLAFRESRFALSPFWDTAGTSGLGSPTNAGATLGRVLFYDKRLSITNTHSCDSCHIQALGFTTSDRFPMGAPDTPLKRNAMALANTRFNFIERWFSDHRTDRLEKLVLMPIEEPAELANLLPLLEKKLAATDFYPPLFEAAFGTPEVTRERISTALAHFLRTIITYRSRFDQAYLPMTDPPTPAPDPNQFLTAEELRGAELFRSSHCRDCHKTELQTLEFAHNNGLDAVPIDPGADLGQFRAASLRNIAVTAPYMHDGRFATLREVIDHYDHGVVDSPLTSVLLRDHQLAPVRRLNLSESDKNALEAFLRTLTDTELLSDPKFSDPF